MITHSRRRPALFAILGTCLALSLLLGIAELTTRRFVEKRISDASMRVLQTKADVSLGGPPALTQLAQQHFPSVQLSAANASFGQVSDLDINARLTDVRRQADKLTVDRTDVIAAAQLASLNSTFSSRLGRNVAVTADPQTQTLLLRTGPAGLVQITLRPTLVGATLRFVTQATTVAGTPVAVPPNAEGLPNTIDLSDLPLGLKANGVAVAEDGLRVNLTGGEATMLLHAR